MSLPETATTNDPSVLIKAGGLVWDSERPSRQLVVIHRPKYGDWTLPKGKREPHDTSWLDAAQREVREEAHCETKVLGFAGATHYTANNLPNVVLFWEMLRTGDAARDPNVPEETDEVVWLTPVQAIKKLTHPAERQLIVQLTGKSTGPPAPSL